MSSDLVWLDNVEVVPSPNCNLRPDSEVSLLVIHNISLPPGQYGGGYIQKFFQNALPVSEDAYFQEIGHLEVSSHFLIERNGKVSQFVPLDKRAWHAGVSSFQGRGNCNDFSVGVELEGTDDEPYADEQYKALVDLTLEIQKIYPLITPQRITGHCDIAPDRKTDPGPAFDWKRYLNGLQS